MPDLSAFQAGGKMGELIRHRDWSATALGPVEMWPQSLRSAVGIALRSASPASVFWGEDHIFLYNDAWAEMLGERHPSALGRPAREVWAEAWDQLEPRFDAAFEKAESVNQAGVKLMRPRNGRLVETYWSYALLPLGNEEGRVGGLLGQALETTASVLRQRHDALMRRLDETLRPIEDAGNLIGAALDVLNAHLQADWLCFTEIDRQTDVSRCIKCVRGVRVARANLIELNWWLGSDIEAELKEGVPIPIEDVRGDQRLVGAPAKEHFDEAGVRSVLILPIGTDDDSRPALVALHSKRKSWNDEHIGNLLAAAKFLSREMARARAQTELLRSEERYRSLFEQANDIILTANLDQIITDCNPAGAAAMGLPRKQIIGRSIAEFVSPQGYQQTTQMLRQKLEKGGTTRHEIDVLAPSGEVLHWEVNSSLARDADDRPIGLHAIIRDVTERRRQEQRQRLLINELNHRVKNTLSLVQGLALQTFKDGREISEARTIFQDRLGALANAHDLMTRESWEGVTLNQLVEQAVGHHNGASTRITWKGPPIRLNPKAAVSLVMAFHELATNATKYGALKEASGRVDISWRSSSSDQMIMKWRERGGPRVTKPTRRGFGLRMIERALASDLAGNASLEFAPSGFVCKIDAPLERITVRRELG